MSALSEARTHWEATQQKLHGCKYVNGVCAVHGGTARSEPTKPLVEVKVRPSCNCRSFKHPHPADAHDKLRGRYDGDTEKRRFDERKATDWRAWDEIEARPDDRVLRACTEATTDVRGFRLYNIHGIMQSGDFVQAAMDKLGLIYVCETDEIRALCKKNYYPVFENDKLKPGVFTGFGVLVTKADITTLQTFPTGRPVPDELRKCLTGHIGAYVEDQVRWFRGVNAAFAEHLFLALASATRKRGQSPIDLPLAQKHQRFGDISLGGIEIKGALEAAGRPRLHFEVAESNKNEAYSCYGDGPRFTP